VFFPLIAPSVLGVCVCLGVSYSLWKHRPGPAWGYATLTGLCVAVWCGGQAAWLLFSDGPAGEFIAPMQYVGIALSPPLWLMTGLAYVGERAWLRPARIGALLVVPVLTILAVATNDAHGLIWERLVPVEGQPNVDVHFGTWFYVHMVYSYVTGGVGSLLMAARFVASPLYKRQLGLVLIGSGLVLIANLLYLSSRVTLPIDPTPIVFAAAFAGVGWAMSRHHFFSALPMARGLTVEGLRDGLVVVNAEGVVVDSNPAAQAMVGATVGTPLARVLTAPSDSGVDEAEPREILMPDGARVEVRVTPVRGGDGVLEGKVVLLRDVTAERQARETLLVTQTELQRANLNLGRLALTDTLTGLANRRHMEISCDEEFSRARRHARPLSFVMMDIDHFKRVNDDHGHGPGDRVLSSCGRAIEAQLRPGDLAARLGGDEFGVLLPETSRADAAAVARRLREVLRERSFVNDRGETIHVTVSLGVSSLRDSDRGPDDLLARADRALYEVKNSGRDGISVDHDAA
jgi:diguanylate cyclase (GGDEF)-like protein